MATLRLKERNKRKAGERKRGIISIIKEVKSKKIQHNES